MTECCDCAAPGGPEWNHFACEACKHKFCEGCSGRSCWTCSKMFCGHCSFVCEYCEEYHCWQDSTFCHSCDKTSECDRCRIGGFARCYICNFLICDYCLHDDDKGPYCETCRLKKPPPSEK